MNMELSKSEQEFLIAEISRELGAKRDGSGKNLITLQCPVCGKGGGKYGVYIGRETTRKKTFMSHCFSCGYSTRTLEQLLEVIGRLDLMIAPTADVETPLENVLLLKADEPEEIDDELCTVELPDFFKRTFRHPYLQGRGFCFDDYEYFPVGCTGRLNVRYADYVIFLIVDAGANVGFVARHIWSKKDIDAYNRRAKRTGDYKILRYRNSTDNDFSKLLYNYDTIIEGETDTVVLTEGIFDVVALTRRLDWYDNTRITAVATFGKKISDVQIYKLQCKGVKSVVVGYDGDAVDTVKTTIDRLHPYFEVLVADIPDARKDWEDLTDKELYEVFSSRLLTPLEYKLKKVQEL